MDAISITRAIYVALTERILIKKEKLIFFIPSLKGGNVLHLYAGLMLYSMTRHTKADKSAARRVVKRESKGTACNCTDIELALNAVACDMTS